MRTRFIVAGACVALACMATNASALTSSEEVALYSAFREAHGFPGVVEDPALSYGCALHNNYQRINGVFGHGEDPSLPGYTSQGAAAGSKSILSRGYGHSFARDIPFALAPLHFAQMMAPALAVTGLDAASDLMCIQTLAGLTRTFSEDRLFVYPAEGGTIAPKQKAFERPFVPGDLVGLPMGTTTGPHLFVFGVGRLSGNPRTATSVPEAGLTGPDGAVPIEVVSSADWRVADYLPNTTAILIPRSPLRADALYTAHATLARGAVRVNRTWTFRTEPSPPPSDPPSTTPLPPQRTPDPQDVGAGTFTGDEEFSLDDVTLAPTALHTRVRLVMPVDERGGSVDVAATLSRGETTLTLPRRRIAGDVPSGATLRWSRTETSVLERLTPGRWILHVAVTSGDGIVMSAGADLEIGARPALVARAQRVRSRHGVRLRLTVRAGGAGRLTITRAGGAGTGLVRVLLTGRNVFGIAPRALRAMPVGSELLLRYDPDGAGTALTRVRVGGVAR